ncbi:Insulinase (Peptidase family M16) family protein [Striga hermonthica]|uniref:Insulinase (Peptidase family M16) family protein n=1 Tax=Striga hermonthica TaxID=68872 RepID=A0A9N7MPY8_STRHE|nr:Insulinase (Peptidase family M16) family protein [Striga hermonthica]
MRHEAEIKSNTYWLGLMAHLQATSVPSKDISCIKDLISLYEAATVEDVYTAYEQLQIDENSLYSCIGIAGVQVGESVEASLVEEESVEGLHNARSRCGWLLARDLVAAGTSCAGTGAAGCPRALPCSWVPALPWCCGHARKDGYLLEQRDKVGHAKEARADSARWVAGCWTASSDLEAAGGRPRESSRHAVRCTPARERARQSLVATAAAAAHATEVHIPFATVGPEEPHAASTAWPDSVTDKQNLDSLGSETERLELEKFLSLELPPHPKLRRGQLKNGLRYLILPNKVPPNRFEAHMEVHVGSIDEEDDEQGVAHMIEHVAFLGKRRAILSELQMMNTIEYRVDCQLLQHLHSENKLSKRFPIGLEEQIKKWDADKIRKFHERWYFQEMLHYTLLGILMTLLIRLTTSKQFLGRLAHKLRHLLHLQLVLLVQWPVFSFLSYAKPPQIFQHELLQHFSINMFCKIPVNKVRTYRDLRMVLMKRIFLSALHFRINTRYQSSNPPFTSVELDHSDSAREGCTVTSLTVTAEPQNWENAIKVAVQEVKFVILKQFCMFYLVL